MRVHARRSSLLHIIVRILAIVALALPLAPQPTANAQVVPNAPCPTRITLTGPSDGSLEQYYGFSATVEPSNSGPSLQVQWVVTDKDPIVVTTSVSSQEFSWASGGTKTILVRASVMDGTCHAISE